MKAKELIKLLESVSDDTEIYLRKAEPPGDVEPAQVVRFRAVFHGGKDWVPGVIIEKAS